MGLDGVELVMAYEEAFGVEIDEAAAEKMTAPRHVIDFIEEQFEESNVQLCISRRAFHEVRNRLMGLGYNRKEVRPNALLEKYFPVKTRQRDWKKVRDQSGKIAWPELVRSRRTRELAVFGVFIVVFGLLAFGDWLNEKFNAGVYSFELILPLLGLPLACWLLAKLTSPWRICFPQMTTVKDLAIRLSGLQPTTFLKANERLARPQIATLVKQITIEQLGIKESSYDEDKNFVRDFGIG